jgi:Domain of unknown function (DUF4335)
MSIRRQYSLPNCTLILDGISDGQRTNEARPLMSTLVNAECHISGQKKPLTGGMEFFQQLITAVSNYTQELLSKVVNTPTAQQVGKVRLEKGQEHRLTAQSEQGEVDWQLSTVQLFDLTEAIDQFLADGSTLPTLLVGIQPAPRAAKGAVSAQAAPIGLGLSGLAATALAFYLVPAPTKITLPDPAANTAAVSKTSDKPVKSNDKSSTPATSPAGAKQSVPVTSPVTSPSSSPVSSPSNSPPASPSPTSTSSSTPAASKKPVERSAVESKVNENPTQVAFIERKLRREISQKWEDRKGISNKLDYTLTADEEGKIVSYVPKNPVAESKKDIIPLSKMVPADAEKAETSESPGKKTADFSVSFTPNGAIEIKRDKLLAGNPTDGKPLADTDRVKSLAKDLESKVKLAAAPTFKNELTYRVAADENGEIVDYDPLNGAAFDHEKETPLPAVTKYDAEAASGTKPLAQYTVVYRPDGKIDIKPRK